MRIPCGHAIPKQGLDQGDEGRLFKAFGLTLRSPFKKPRRELAFLVVVFTSPNISLPRWWCLCILQSLCVLGPWLLSWYWWLAIVKMLNFTTLRDISHCFPGCVDPADVRFGPGWLLCPYKPQQSSAKSLQWVAGPRTDGRSFINKRNSNGLNTDLCGTPDVTGAEINLISSTTTLRVRPVGKAQI